MLLASDKKLKRTDILFVLCFAAAILFLIHLAPYGWSGADESFYVAGPQRFAKGDRFFVDSWNCGQLFCFVTVPLVRLYERAAGSSDGIILGFRYYYIAANALIALLIYLRGRRISRPGALFAALFLMLYSPLGVRNLSYNAMGMMALSAACVLSFTADGSVRPLGVMYFAGLFFAVAVLNCPFMAVLYLLYIIFAFILCRLKKHGRAEGSFTEYAFSPKGVLGATLGCGTLFVIWLVYTLSRSEISEIFKFFPFLFVDPEHPPMSEWWMIKNLLYCVIASAPGSQRVLLLFGAGALIMLADRKRIVHRKYYVLYAAAMTVLYALPFAAYEMGNAQMFALNILGITAYFLTEKKQKSIFRLMFVPGLVYAVCMHRASSLRYYGLCNGISVCCLASSFFIVNLIKEMRAERKNAGGNITAAVCVLAALLLPAQAGLEAHSNAVYFFHDDRPEYLDTRIEEGVQKGLITTPAHAGEYSSLMEDTQWLRERDGEYSLYITERGWLPLADSKRTACHSVWTDFDKPAMAAQLLKQYLELHPEKIPEYIYVTKSFRYTYQPDIDGMEVVDVICRDGWSVTESSTGYIIHTE